MGGILRIFNDSVRITGHSIYLNNGSKVEIYQKLAVYSLFLYVYDTIIERNTVDCGGIHYESPIFMISNNSYTKILSNVCLNGSIFENYGVLTMGKNSQISTMTSDLIAIGQSTNIISYLQLQSHSTLLINSGVKAYINAPIWSKSNSVIMMHSNSTLFINDGGICDDHGVFNISINSQIVLTSNVYIFNPYSQIIGSGVLDIKTTVYPPLNLSKLPKLMVHEHGIMSYTNFNVSNPRLGYNLGDMGVVGVSYNEKYISDIFIDGGGIRLEQNVSVLISDITLYSGSLITDSNSTIGVDGKFSYYSGLIEGNINIFIFECIYVCVCMYF